jgi:hypothetical protein
VLLAPACCCCCRRLYCEFASKVRMDPWAPRNCFDLFPSSAAKLKHMSDRKISTQNSTCAGPEILDQNTEGCHQVPPNLVRRGRLRRQLRPNCPSAAGHVDRLALGLRLPDPALWVSRCPKTPPRWLRRELSVDQGHRGPGPLGGALLPPLPPLLRLRLHRRPHRRPPRWLVLAACQPASSRTHVCTHCLHRLK